MANLDTLAEKLANGLSGNEKVIGIDGIDGIGKTPLAQLLGAKVGASVISCDDYLIKNQDRYVGALTDDLCKEFSKRNGTIIIEGVCLLATAKKFGFSIDCLVYLKRMHSGLWTDEDICDFSGDPEDIIRREEQKMIDFEEWDSQQQGRPPKDPKTIRLSGLRSELIRYNAEYNPHRSARFVLEVEHA